MEAETEAAPSDREKPSREHRAVVTDDLHREPEAVYVYDGWGMNRLELAPA